MRLARLALATLVVCALPATVYVTGGPEPTGPLVATQPNPVKWSLVVTSTGPVMPGKGFDASLVATIRTGWHLYALEEPPGGPQPTAISVAPGGPFSMNGEIVAASPERSFDPNFGMETEYYNDTARFLVPLRVAAGTTHGKHRLAVLATWVTCSDTFCMPPADVTVSLDVWVGPVPPSCGHDCEQRIRRGVRFSASRSADVDIDIDEHIASH